MRQELEKLMTLVGFIDEMFGSYADRIVLNRKLQIIKITLKNVYGWKDIDKFIPNEVNRAEVKNILEILLRYNNIKDLDEKTIEALRGKI